jgi:hypothetical protein
MCVVFDMNKRQPGYRRMVYSMGRFRFLEFGNTMVPVIRKEYPPYVEKEWISRFS